MPQRIYIVSNLNVYSKEHSLPEFGGQNIMMSYVPKICVYFISIPCSVLKLIFKNFVEFIRIKDHCIQN